MCNRLHRDSKFILESGTGYKIFTEPEENKILSLVNEEEYTNIEDDGYIQWEWNEEEDRGFCFFIKKEEALKAAKAWKNSVCDKSVIKKIHYKGGIGQHIESNFIGGYDIKVSICQSFKIMEGEEV